MYQLCFSDEPVDQPALQQPEAKINIVEGDRESLFIQAASRKISFPANYKASCSDGGDSAGNTVPGRVCRFIRSRPLGDMSCRASDTYYHACMLD